MAAAVGSTTIADALRDLQTSSEAAAAVLPNTESIKAPENGISLFDAKNEIFLSYLQSLALRNLEVLRSVRKFIPGRKDAATQESSDTLRDEVVDNLIRQRVYLEKGVRPLEDRLKYTIDKTLRAATEEERRVQQGESTEVKKAKKQNAQGSGSDSEDDSESSSSEEDEDADGLAPAPNRAAMLRPEDRKTQRGTTTSRPSEQDRKGVYRPPRVTATSMPENFDRREKRKEKPNRSHTLDEYVSSEMADGPMAQPSIGSTIAQGGRHQVSARERAAEAERREYEETHLMRLPKESKKEKAKKGRREGGGFGGEDWRGLGEGLDRIDVLTKGVKRQGGREGALEKSRKRRATEDAPRQDGTGGGLFDRRKKRLNQKLR